MPDLSQLRLLEVPGSCLPVSQTCTCAVCGHSVGLDTDHVEIDAQTVWMDDLDQARSYVLHLGCAESTIGAWEEPA